MRTLLLFLGVLAAVTLAPAAPSGAVIREPGAVYLEDLVPRPLRITVAADAPIFYAIDMQRFLGTLRKDQPVELQAISDDGRAYRVRGQAQQGQVAGWVDPKYLVPLKREFLAALRSNAARHRDVQALIAKNEIAINMTEEEVIAALGKPSRKATRVDAGGKGETWEFVRFERVPQQSQGYDPYGRLVVSTVYVKVPAGKLSVSFENSLVSALEQTEGTLDRDARARIITAPLVVNFAPQ